MTTPSDSPPAGDDHQRRIAMLDALGQAGPELPEGLSPDELLERLTELGGERDQLTDFVQLVLDTLTDGYWDWWPGEEFEYMSPRFWEILGQDPTTKRHHPSEWQDLIHPEDLQVAMANIQRHVETRGEHPYDQEVRYLHAEGHWVTVRCRGQVVEWEPDGGIRRMVGSHTDITLEKHDQERAHILYESGVVGVWDWFDVEQDEEYWSPSFYELLGHDPLSLPASLASFQEILHPDDRERTFAMVKAHFEERAPFLTEYRLRCGDGSYRWFLGSGQATFDAEGKPRRMVGSILDVHERRLSEERLRDLALRHRLTLAASGVGVWAWRHESGELDWDEGMHALFGISPETPPGKLMEAWRALVHPEDLGRIESELEAARAGGPGLDTTFRLLEPTGTQRYIRAIASLQGDVPGEPPHLVGVNWDVTEQTLTARRLERSNEELSEFAYRTAHDLRGPAQTIRSLARMAEEDIADGELADAVESLRRIRRQTVEMEELVDGILELSRSDLAEADQAAAGVDSALRETFESTLRPLAGDAVLLELQLEGEFQTPLPHRRLQQILTNLVSNGIRYRDPARESHVRASIHDRGDHLSLEVIDNGLGIPEEEQERAFDVFTRFHAGLGTGTGLGLAIVKRHVERLGGSLKLASSGEGTRMTITVPYPSGEGT